MIAGDVMDSSAALLNDSAKTNFTYAAQLPYLKIAAQELQEEMELANVPTTNKKSSVFVITTAMTDIGGTTGPALPTDLIEIQGAYERLSGSNEDFQYMSKVEFLPPFTVLLESLVYWAWQGQVVNFLGATTTRDVRLDYIATFLPTIVDENTSIVLFNSKSFLTYRNSALCAEFIGENKTRADELNVFAGQALDRFLGINNKGRQSFPVRRRPFMAGYKVRAGF